MKKLYIYFFLIVLICFFIPIIFTNSINKVESIAVLKDINSSSVSTIEENDEEFKFEYNYKEESIIKLLHTSLGIVEEINLDEYLLGVISAEMPATYEMEALKAQAVVARSYTLYKVLNSKPHGEEADICDNFNCCQAYITKEDRFEKWNDNEENEYWKKINLAVKETEGKVITYDSKIINAFFHANSGGKTEVPVNVWGGENYPYLEVVETSGEEGYTQYSSELKLTIDEFINKIKEKYDDLKIDFENNISDEIKIEEYTEKSGRVKTFKVGNKKLSGVEIRQIIGLKSTNFEILIEDNNIEFFVKGYGHGIGMSQTGANTLAKEGKNYEEIIKHFYKDVKIENY